MTPSTELTEREQHQASVALAGIEQKDLVFPQIKVTQALSGEVTKGEVEAGHFVNSVTGEDYGKEIDLIVAFYVRGRFYAPDDEERVYVATSDVAPGNWPEEFAGQAFADIPVAEEQHAARANDRASKDTWGSGPAIQTTHNWLGFLPSEPGLPVRLSLKSAQNRAHRKIATLVSIAGSPWAAAIRLATFEDSNKKNQPFFNVAADRGEQTTREQRAAAFELSKRIEETEAAFAGDAPDDTEKGKRKGEKPKDGLDV